MEKISVCMAVKNEESHIYEALVSILEQNNCNFEIIIVDDNSTDNTVHVINSIIKESNRVKLYRNKKIGKVSAFNMAVSIATGEYVCFFAGDDIMPGNSLYKRYNEIKSISPNERGVHLCKLQVLSSQKGINGTIIPKKKGKGTTSGATMMLSKALTETCFPIPESLPNEDSWLSTCVNHLPYISIIHSDVIGCIWRQHDGNSLSVFEDFKIYSAKLHNRSKGLGIFIDVYKKEISNKSLDRIESEIKIEKSRFSGQIRKILFEKNSSVIQKLRAISTSNVMIFKFRRYFFKLFSGW